MQKRILFGVSTLLCCSTAWADFTPGNWTDVSSHHLPGDAQNVTKVYEYTGPDFTVGTLDWSGNGEAFGTSHPNETRCWVTAPNGKSAGFQLSTYYLNPIFPSSGLSDYFNGTQAQGTWTFEFSESYDDWTPDPDAIHENIQFTFYDDAIPIPAFPELEKFNYGIPDDWTLVDNTGQQDRIWRLNTELFRDFRFARKNLTGGDGACAMIDSDILGQVVVDSELISPPFIVPTTDAALEFDHDFNWISDSKRSGDRGDEIGDVDIYTEAKGWENLARYEYTDFGGHVSLDLSAYAGQEAQIRFHYWFAYYDMWWQVDNVAIAGLPSIPTVSEWGMIAMTLLVLTAGTVLFVRKRTVTA